MLDIVNGIAGAAFELTAEMAPYLLFGIAAAGALHVVLPKHWISRGLGGPGLRPVVRAALIGIPLPLCSCSVVPVTASLKKNGASDGASVSFLVTTPTSGVDSIFATYSLLGGVFAVARVIASFIIGLAAGAVTSLLPSEKKPAPAPPSEAACDTPAPPTKKPNPVREAVVYGFDELLGGMAKSLALGLLLGGAVAYFLPADYLHHTVGTGFAGYALMAGVGIPLYVCASGSIPLAASFLAKGISPGAALVFLIAGPATNAAVVTVIGKTIGKRALAVFLSVLFIGALAAGWSMDALGSYLSPWMPTPDDHGAHGGLTPVQTVSAVLLIAAVLFHLVRPFAARAFAKKGSPDMFQLRVPDMTCAHCAKTITDAVSGLEGVKDVHADPNTKIVALDLSDTADEASLIRAVSDAGYSPEKV